MSSYNAALKTYPSIDTYKCAGDPPAADDVHAGWEVALLDGLPHSLPFTSHSYPGKKKAPSAAARFLKRMLNPGMLAATAMLGNSIGGSIVSAVNPFQPVTLRDYMVEIYHQRFCGAHDPNTPINPEIWKSLLPILVMMAQERMREGQENRLPRNRSQTPTLPTDPAPIAPPMPGETPVPPCCAGGNLVATLRRQGGKKSGAGTQISLSLKA